MKTSLKKLGDICKINPSKTEINDRSTDLDVGFLAMTDVSDEANIIQWQNRKLGEVKNGFTYFRDGDVLLAKITPCMENGKGALVEGARSGIGFGSTEFFVLRPDPSKLSNKFLYYVVSDKSFRQKAASYMTGSAGQQRLSSTYLEKYLMPVPPLERQNEIVNKLDKIKNALHLSDELLSKTNELLESLTIQHLNVGKKTKLGTFFIRITDTVLPSDQPDNSFNYIGLENITSHTGQLVSFKPTVGRLIRSNKTVFKKGDVLYGKLRPYLNKVWLAEFDGVCSTDIWVLRAEEKKITPELLSLILRTSFIVKRAIAFMKGANLPRVDKNSFDDIRVSIPNYSEQAGLIKKFASVFEYKNQLIQQRESFEELLNSVLFGSIKGKYSKIKDVETEAKVNKFALQQAIAAVLQRFERGEMVLAKVLYIAQEVYQVPLGFKFAAQHFGPYDTEIKRMLMAGMSTYNRFFTRKGTGVYALGANSGKLFKYRSKVLGNMTAVLNDLLPYIKNADSSSIECLATVCKIMQDNQTTDLDVIKQKMHEWKKNKFSPQLIKGTYDFAISKGWDKKLLK